MESEKTADLMPADPLMLRRQILMSALATCAAALLFWFSDFPNGGFIVTTSLIASAAYALFYFFFDSAYRRFPAVAGACLSGLALLLLASTVHFSGGVVSPFVFLYFCVLISEALYGMDSPVTLPLAIGSYVGVCLGEATGFIAPANQWAAIVYRSKAVTLLIVSSTVAFMWLTRHIAVIIVTNLRASINRQGREKDDLLKKFSELNASSQIGVLAHRIAHDMRGPISSISGYIQVEMVKEKAPEDLQMLKDLNEMVTSLAESLNGITRFGKAYDRTAEKIQLQEFIRNLLGVVSFSPYAHDVKFVKRFTEKLPASVSASRSDLQQAFFNIIKNAVEALRDKPDGKVIEISIERDGGDATVTIADNGPGMPPELLQNVFKRSLTTKNDGTGIGLIITRDLVVRNYGSIGLHNRPEGGLSVTVSLPLV